MRIGDELGRAIGPQELDGRVLARLHTPQGLERRRRVERVHSGDALVEDGPEREEVAARIDAFATRLLGAHVAELALQLLRPRVLGRVLDRAPCLGDAEVGDFDLALEREEHVLRRHVAVHDAERPHLLVAPPVRVVEALRDLGRYVHAHVDRQRDLVAPAAREDAREVEAVHVLHRDVVRVGRRCAGRLRGRSLAEVEHLDDVRVRQADGELRLVDEHLDEVRATGELRQNSLDDEDLLEALDAVALRLEHLGHAALPEPLEQAIATKRCVHPGNPRETLTPALWLREL